jgi:hypothetical protein
MDIFESPRGVKADTQLLRNGGAGRRHRFRLMWRRFARSQGGFPERVAEYETLLTDNPIWEIPDPRDLRPGRRRVCPAGHFGTDAAQRRACRRL